MDWLLSILKAPSGTPSDDNNKRGQDCANACPSAHRDQRCLRMTLLRPQESGVLQELSSFVLNQEIGRLHENHLKAEGRGPSALFKGRAGAAGRWGRGCTGQVKRGLLGQGESGVS